MSRILTLIKTDLNTTFGLPALRYKMRSKNERWTIIILLIAMTSLIPSYYLIISGLSGMYNIYLDIGQKSMFLLNGMLATQLIVFFFGIIYVMSKYYFSNDLNILVPLPLRPKEIVGAKFVSLMVNEYFTCLPIILPFIIIYGISGSENILYWIYSIIVILFIPVIPLTLSSIIVMVFMKYTNIKGKKDLLRIIGYFLLIIGILAFQFKIQSMVGDAVMSEEDFLIKMITDSSLLVKRLGIVFPPSMWATLSLSNNFNITGLIYLTIFAVVSITLFLIMIYLGEKVFFEGLIGNNEVHASKGSKKINVKDFGKKSPAYLAIGLKEIKMLVRTPVYLFNSIGGVVIMPIILIMSFLTGGDQSMDLISNLMVNNANLVSLASVGLITLLGIMNCVGCTTFSREGRSMWIQRTLPIGAKDQIFGRVISSLFVQLIGIVILIGVIAYIGVLNLESILWIIILGVLGSITMTELGMIVDILRPILDWDNPQKVMKQNLNVLIAMGVGTLYILGVGFLTYKLIDMIDIMFIYILVGIIFTVSSFIFYILLKKLIERKFKALE